MVVRIVGSDNAHQPSREELRRLAGLYQIREERMYNLLSAWRLEQSPEPPLPVQYRESDLFKRDARKALNQLPVAVRREFTQVSSVFAAEMAKYKDLIDADGSYEVDGDGVSLAMTRSLLIMTLNLLPIAEGVYNRYKTDKSYYPINGLVNQARELAADLRQLSDRTQLSGRLMKDVVDPVLSALAQQLSLAMNVLGDELYTNSQLSQADIKTAVQQVRSTLLDYVRSIQGQFRTEIQRVVDSK